MMISHISATVAQSPTARRLTRAITGLSHSSMRKMIRFASGRLVASHSSGRSIFCCMAITFLAFDDRDAWPQQVLPGKSRGRASRWPGGTRLSRRTTFSVCSLRAAPGSRSAQPITATVIAPTTMSSVIVGHSQSSTSSTRHLRPRFPEAFVCCAHCRLVRAKAIDIQRPGAGPYDTRSCNSAGDPAWPLTV